MTHEINHPMIHAARDRAQVWVLTGGEPRRAILVAWEPKRNGRRMWGKCRVQFSSGKAATIATDRVALYEAPAAEVPA